MKVMERGLLEGQNQDHQRTRKRRWTTCSCIKHLRLVLVVFIVAIFCILGSLRDRHFELDGLSMNCLRYSPFFFRIGCDKQLVEDQDDRVDDHIVDQVELFPPPSSSDLDDIDIGQNAGKGKGKGNQTVLETFHWDKMPTRLTKVLDGFNAPACKRHRTRVSGDAANDELGKYGRAKCVDGNRTKNFISEKGSQVVISDDFKLIYVPSMKVASLMFKNTMLTRFNATMIGIHLLNDHLSQQNRTIDDYLVFTFVRDPLSTFFSAYAEIDKRFQKSTPAFQTLNRTMEFEPERALSCLNMVRRGNFHRRTLTTKHMFSQLWKTQRCLTVVQPGFPPTKHYHEIQFNFIGNLENIKDDFQALETIIGVAHVPLKRIHAPKTVHRQHAQMLKDLHLPKLEKQICEYYQADYDCFNYNLPDSCK